MKKKLLYLFVMVFIISAIALIIITNLNQKKGSQVNNNQIIAYTITKNWQVVENKPDYILLNHKSGSSIEIKLTKLTPQQQATDLKTLVNEVRNNIEAANLNYHLIIKKEGQLLKSQSPATQLVYENAQAQSLIEITKTNQYLIVINYAAPNTYFDILLSNYRAFANSIDLLNPDYNLTYKAISVSGITFDQRQNSDYEQTANFMIADNHYEVEYSLPKICDLTNFDTTTGYHKCNDIDITVSNEYQNLYALITDKKAYGSIAYEINYLQKNKDYDEVVVTNDKIDKGYRYKINYLSKDHKKSYEVLYILTELDYLRTNVIKISTQDQALSANLITKIKLNKVTKYGWNINKPVANGLYQEQLQEYVNSYDQIRKYYAVSYSIPAKYEERDYEQNKYLYRYFQYEYDIKRNDYNYDISLEINRYGDSQTVIANVQSDYQELGDYSITKIADIGSFGYYSGSYVEDNKTYYEAYLVQDLSAGGYLNISFRSDVKPIPQDIVNDFTNMTIEVKTKGGE